MHFTKWMKRDVLARLHIWTGGFYFKNKCLEDMCYLLIHCFGMQTKLFHRFYFTKLLYRLRLWTPSILQYPVVPVNADGEELGIFTAHFFRRGGAKHRFVTGKSKWPLDLVKWWSGWGFGDDDNTMIHYFLEEISKYENSYTNYLYTRGSDLTL